MLLQSHRRILAVKSLPVQLTSCCHAATPLRMSVPNADCEALCRSAWSVRSLLAAMSVGVVIRYAVCSLAAVPLYAALWVFIQGASLIGCTIVSDHWHAFSPATFLLTPCLLACSLPVQLPLLPEVVTISALTEASMCKEPGCLRS